jgi:hypothetical protein
MHTHTDTPISNKQMEDPVVPNVCMQRLCETAKISVKKEECKIV